MKNLSENLIFLFHRSGMLGPGRPNIFSVYSHSPFLNPCPFSFSGIRMVRARIGPTRLTWHPYIVYGPILEYKATLSKNSCYHIGFLYIYLKYFLPWSWNTQIWTIAFHLWTNWRKHKRTRTQAREIWNAYMDTTKN